MTETLRFTPFAMFFGIGASRPHRSTDIAAAAGMNRPSLYGAFEDKREMYLAALRMFAAESGREMQKALEAPTLREALEAFYAWAIQEYVSGKGKPD